MASDPRLAPSRPGPSWKSADVLRAAAIVFGLYLGLRLIWLVHPLLLAAFLGVLFGLAVARAADFLERFRVPRGLGAVLVVFGFYGLLVGVGAASAPTLKEQFGELRRQLPEAISQVDRWIATHRDGFVGQILSGDPQEAPADSSDDLDADAAPEPTGRPREERPVSRPDGGTQAAPAAGGKATTPAAAGDEAEPGAVGSGTRRLRATLADQLGAVSGYLFSFLSSTVAVLAGLLLITFVALYLGADPKLYHRGILHLVPHPARPRAVEVLGAMGNTLRRWLLAQFVAMLTIGVVTAVALSILGVKAAISLGIIAGLLEFIPTIGPLLSAVPAVAMAFLDSPQKALAVVLVYWGIQFLENHVLIPLLMKQGVDLPPVLTLLGQALMAIVFGFLGLLVAVPLIAAAVVAIKMLYVEDVVGDEPAAPPPASG